MVSEARKREILKSIIEVILDDPLEYAKNVFNAYCKSYLRFKDITKEEYDYLTENIVVEINLRDKNVSKD